MTDYTYRMTDIVTYDDETAYAIDFEQKENVEFPLFKGTIYINTADFGILHAEFEINPTLIHKMKDSFVSSSSQGFNTWPVSVKYSVSYRKINDRYFLKSCKRRSGFHFKAKEKNFSIHSLRYSLNWQLLKLNLNNVKRFEREELAPIHSIFSKTINKLRSSILGKSGFSEA